MAEQEQPAPEEVLEPEGVADEAPAEQEAPQEADPIEKLAMDLGWTPRDQFKGDPDEWKPADEFIRNGRDVQRSLTKELRDVRATVSNMSRVQHALFEDKWREREQQLLQARSQAVEAGDVAALNQIDEARFQHHQRVPQVIQPTTPEPDPVVTQWAQKNASWFNKDLVATQRALSVAQMYADRGADAATQAREAEKAIRREFPEYFGQQGKPAPEVNGAQSRVASTSKRNKGFNDLPPAAQKAARDFEEKQGVPREKYAELYWRDQAA